MADMPITPNRGTAPLQTPNGSGRLDLAGPPEPPAAPAGGETPQVDGGSPAPARDAMALSGKPGTSRLTLPSLSTVGDVAARGARAAEALANPEALQGLTDSAQGMVDMVSGAGDTANGLSETFRNAASQTVKVAERLNETIGEGTRAGNAMMIGGGTLGVVGGGAQVAGGVGKLNDGDATNDTEGALEVAQGALRMGEGGGMVFATAAANSTRFASAATTVGGKVVPVLGAAAGAVQFTNAIMKDPADIKSATTGAMTAIGSAAMLFPPAGTAIGGVMVATAAVIDNWDTISSAAGTAATAVGDAAGAVGNAASNAAKTVAGWFGW